MDSDNDVFTLPPYLLKTPYGESLLRQLAQPSPSEQEISRSTRLSATGVLGALPSRFNHPGYHDQVLSMTSYSPHISNTASRLVQNDDNDNDTSMMDASRVQPHELGNDDELDNLGSIRYGGNNILDDDDDDDDDAMRSDHEEDDMGPDFSGSSLSLRPMSNRRRSSSASHGHTSRGTTAASDVSILGRFIYPLPVKWIPNASTQLSVSDSGLTLKVEQVRAASSSSGSISKNYDYQCAKANSEIPVNTGVFYFETKILTATNNNNKGLSDVVVGFMHAGLSGATKMPGLEVGSYGLNGRDGTTTANQTISRRYSREFGQGDVIGCGVNFATKSIFYTKNGIYLGVAFKDISKALVPSIGLKSGNSVATNFGMTTFRFDIEGYIDQEKLKISQKILEHTSTGHAGSGSASNNACNDVEMRVNSYTDKEIPTLMQKLVSSYFDHLGYVDISKTFAEEVKKEQFQGGSSPGAGSQGADVDSKMDGEADSTTTSVEEANLKTRQQIRKYLLDGDIDGAIKLTTVHFPNVFKEHGEILFKLSCTKFLQLIKQSRIDEALSYGQSLGEQYSSNQNYVDTLNDISTLLAYEDPETQSEFGYLLKEDQTLKISDELNAEILKSLGQSSISDLERLMRHTKAMLKIMNGEKAQLDTLLMTNDDYGL